MLRQELALPRCHTRYRSPLTECRGLHNPNQAFYNHNLIVRPPSTGIAPSIQKSPELRSTNGNYIHTLQHQIGFVQHHKISLSWLKRGCMLYYQETYTHCRDSML